MFSPNVRAMPTEQILHIVGAGLAGSEAAWQAAEAGARVVLHEMRPERMTEAHKTGACAELVCSNSFRSDDPETNAVGLLHEEMRRAGSLIMQAAERHKLPAGGALAVDREGFSADVSERLAAHPNIRMERGELEGLPPPDWSSVIVATGPLTSPSLGAAINALTGEDALSFFDAIAPIVLHESIDMDVAWMASRYGKEGPAGSGADYINCPMSKEQYEAFIDALLAARKDRIQGLGEGHALFRGLPAHRGDGGARARNPALRADETRGARRSAHRPLALRRGAAPAGQRAGHALEHGGLPDQAEARRTDAHFPHDPRAGARRVRAARRPASQYVPEQPEAARHAIAAQGRSAPALRRAGHGRRGLCGVGGHRAARGEIRRREPRRPRGSAPAANHRARRAAGAHHRRASIGRKRRRARAASSR